MPEPVAFIGRETEMALIRSLLEDPATQICCIYAPGGIGKSRLLQEIYQLARAQLPATHLALPVIDFDDYALHLPENLRRRILQALDPAKFEPYFRRELDYRKMQRANFSLERLDEEASQVRQIFIDLVNQFMTNRRLVLCFDTTDKLIPDESVWADLKFLLTHLTNACVLLAGRNAEKFGAELQKTPGQFTTTIHELKPFSPASSREYLAKKQRLQHITLEPELAEKLIILAKGKPILLDLAVEWRAQGISLNWILKKSVENLNRLTPAQTEKYHLKFQSQLVHHIRDLHFPMDQLILIMAYVYPLNVEMLGSLLNHQDLHQLFESAKKYAFVKNLPNNLLTLHDIMRDMVLRYVWPQIPSRKKRQQHYSEKVIQYFQTQLNQLNQDIQKLRQEIQSPSNADMLAVELKTEALEQQIWLIKEQILKHTLASDLTRGLALFEDLYQAAIRASRWEFRQRFLEMLTSYSKDFTTKQMHYLRYYQAVDAFDHSDYSRTIELGKRLSKSSDLAIEQRIETQLLIGNAEIRLGRVEKTRHNFETAVALSENHKLQILEIKAKNGLGWVHRLLGDLEMAQEFYRNARNLCIEAGGPNRAEIQETYGLILNNYAYALSDDNRTRKPAIDMANVAIKHWEKIGHNIGLGAGYLVLGIAYYRSDLAQWAFEAFQKALRIFEPLQAWDWLGQIYSWRGAQYYDIFEFSQAEADFHKSLEIGTQNIKAMTLNRLGRIYMHEKKWDLAEQTLMQSLDYAMKLPDYVYWLGSIARLICVAAKKMELNRLDEFTKEINRWENKVKHYDKNSMGIAYTALAHLALLQNDHRKIDTIIGFLKKGIPLIVEYGSFARMDLITRLNFIQEDFDKVNPESIQKVGQEMKNFAISNEARNINYSAVLDLMFEWSNWKGEKTSYVSP